MCYDITAAIAVAAIASIVATAASHVHTPVPLSPCRPVKEPLTAKGEKSEHLQSKARAQRCNLVSHTHTHIYGDSVTTQRCVLGETVSSR